jgi:hypothetical protein
MINVYIDIYNLLPMSCVCPVDIVLPGTNTSTQAGASNCIPAGQQVLVIKTPKGVYIRTHDGKIFAVRSKGTVPVPSVTPQVIRVGDVSMTTPTTTMSSSSVTAPCKLLTHSTGEWEGEDAQREGG